MKNAEKILLEIKDYQVEINKTDVPSHSDDFKKAGIISLQSYFDFVNIKIDEYFLHNA